MSDRQDMRTWPIVVFIALVVLVFVGIPVLWVHNERAADCEDYGWDYLGRYSLCVDDDGYVREVPDE